MPDRAAYKKQDKSHWPDFKHKPKSTRENKKITNRMARRKKKQEVSGMTTQTITDWKNCGTKMMDCADDESEVSVDAHD